jgi:hypothetical protein
VCHHLSGSGKFFPVTTKEPPKECKQQQQSKMTNSDDNIKWFHQHFSTNYHFLETAVHMVDIALFTIKHIKRLFISHVSNKVKSDFSSRFYQITARQKAILLSSTLNQSLCTIFTSLMTKYSMWITSRHFICLFQVMSQNNHLPWQMFS